MYQIVSARVIHQAIDFANLPKPVVSLAGNYKWPSGKLSCDYRLTWDYDDVLKWSGGRDVEEDYPAFTEFLNQLRGAFCDDITVTAMSSLYGQPKKRGKRILWATLYCTVTPKEPLPVTNR